MKRTWTVTGVKNTQSVTPDWRSVEAQPIDGVVAKEVANVVTNDGYLTELWRQEWDDAGVGQVFQRAFQAGAVSAWHVHERTTDRLFCVVGRVLVVVYDARPESDTAGNIAEYRIGSVRPMLITIPPGVYHGVKNIGAKTAIVMNMVNVAYDYHDPDHWKVSADSEKIPYRFA